MDKRMLAAAAFFAVATAANTAIGFRENVPSEPLGLRIPGTGLHDRAARFLLATGISAPWPMPAAALVAAMSSDPSRRWPTRTVATIGTLLMFGTLVEPVSWGLRSRKPHVLTSIPLNLVSAAALVLNARQPA